MNSVSEQDYSNRACDELACAADETNPGIVRLRISDQKLFPPPAMLSGFSIIGSNWLFFHMAYECSFEHRDWTSGSRGTMVRPAAITELAFEAVKSSSNYLTIFPNYGYLWKSFWDNDVFVNLPAGFGKSLIFRCLPIVADIVHSKPKHACMTSA